MKKVVPFVLFICVGCTSTPKNDEQVEKDSVSVVEATIVGEQEESNVLSLHRYFENATFTLGHSENFSLPPLKKEDGVYNVYGLDDEEPTDVAKVSSTLDCISYLYGDTHIEAVELPHCKENEYVTLIVQEHMGNYISWTLKAFRKEGKDWKDVSSDVLNLSTLGGSFREGLVADDFQYKVENKEELFVQVNQSKFIPSYLENNPEQPIANTTEEERNKVVKLSWSSANCAFLLNN